MSPVKLHTNYISHTDELISLIEKEADQFSIREPGMPYNFTSKYGDSKLKSLFIFNMSDKLKQSILDLLSDEDKTADGITINRYDPGDYLNRHRDSQGGYWKFKLIFLRSDAPHFVWYDAEGTAHIVDESPGAYLEMPVHIEHEITQIKDNEKPKYSLVLSWGM